VGPTQTAEQCQSVQATLKAPKARKVGMGMGMGMGNEHLTCMCVERDSLSRSATFPLHGEGCIYLATWDIATAHNCSNKSDHFAKTEWRGMGAPANKTTTPPCLNRLS
jgi:hypothetical protein